jgi:tetratricopeptide (TPR) repeat protein
MPTRDASRLAQEAAGKALALDPYSAEARSALGMCLFFFEWKWDEADAQFQRAIADNPGYATAYSWYAWLQIARGRFDAAIALMEKARELDPLSRVVVTSAGTAYSFARRYDEALARFEEALKLDPAYPGAHVGRARAYLATGRVAEAREFFENALKNTFDVRLLIGAASAQALMGDREGARARLNDVRGRNQLLPSVMRAQLLFALQDNEAAFQALSDAVDERSSNLLMLFPSPSVDPIRSDPRFKAIIQRVNPELGLLAGSSR